MDKKNLDKQNIELNDEIVWGEPDHVKSKDVYLKNKELRFTNRFDFGEPSQNRFYNTQPIKKPNRFKFIKNDE